MTEVPFGEWLKRQRKASGLTQQQLADQIGCAVITLRKIEAEERRPSEQIVERLAAIFKIPLEEHKSFLRFARGDWQPFASVSAKDEPWHVSNKDEPPSLPTLITSFIGRGKEQTEVIDLLNKYRLVTLTGSGGIGKTRLALKIGEQVLGEYAHGVWLMELASLSDPVLLPQTVAVFFGIAAQSDTPFTEKLINFLRAKTTLLILDNCEHLLDACAQLTDTLLKNCPNLKILASSREPLGLNGEAIYRVPSLGLPPVEQALEQMREYEAVRLFEERAQLVQTDFSLTMDNAAFITRICFRLDGIPLALELVAAKVGSFSPKEIAEQLETSFNLLTSGSRTDMPRQQTIRASIDWSWGLLNASEQVFMQQLSVFAGGWTLEAAQAICKGDVLSLTNSLVRKSLIVVKQEAGRETRYHFHEVIRQYACEKLLAAGDEAAMRDRHLAYYVKLVEQAEPELYHSHQLYWLNKLDDELDNLRMALQWALATDVASGLRIAAISWRFWIRRDYVQEVDDWLGQLLERYPTPDSLRAYALAAYSNYIFFRGNMRRAEPVAEQALQLARSLSDRPTEALALFILGKIIAAPGDHSGGAPFFEQSLAIYRKLGDKIGQATTLMRLSIHHSDPAYSLSHMLESLKLHRDLGNFYDMAFCLIHLARNAIYGRDLSSPPAWLEEARTLCQALGAQPDEADAINISGLLAYWKGNYQQALTCFEEAIALDEKISNRYWALWPHVNMAYAFLRDGDHQQADKHFKICLQQFHKDNSAIGMVYSIEGVASLYVNRTHLEHAVRLFACADAMRLKLGNPRPPIEQGDVDKDITACLAKLGEETFSDIYEDGKKMSLDKAVTYALSELVY